MLSARSVRSLAQFLELQEIDFVLLLCAKHGIKVYVEGGALLQSLLRKFENPEASGKVFAVLDEIVRTKGDLRSRVNPRYRFDERFEDLCKCMQLDGYVVQERKVLPLDPSIAELPALEDDLSKELTSSDLADASRVVERLNSSAESFRASPPNLNACLNDARVALESLAGAIAGKAGQVDAFDPQKWGSIVTHLHSIGMISREEEIGLVGVYRFLSPGSHRPIGLSEAEMTRLGRHLALTMCWFLVKQYRASR